MISGRDALHRIDASIAEARRGLSDTTNAAAARSSRMAAIDRAETDAFGGLAKLRIDSLQSDEMIHPIGADDKAERLIAKHEGHLDDLARSLDQAVQVIEQYEADRRRQEEALETAIAAHEKAAAKTREHLERDEEYLRRSAALDEANAIAERAASKLELARAARTEKGAPYDGDPLFSYLWRRKFSTKDYKAFFLFAALDRWVARLIKYRDVKLNYQRLLELPERLSEHAGRVDAAAADLQTNLEEYERAALERDGVGKLRDKATAARSSLEQTDAAIAEAEARHTVIVKQHGDAASGRDGPMKEARALLAEALSRRSIPDLKIIAAETATLEDDRIVDELIRLKRERFELEENQRAVERSLNRGSDLLAEVENLRRRFKSARYDSPYSEFADGGIVGVILSELLRGALSQSSAWRRLQKAQRTRQRDWSEDFGGDDWRGGFGLPQDWGRRGSPFPTPRGSRSRRAPRLPRAPRPPRAPRFPRPRRGGGGFKTGGGF